MKHYTVYQLTTGEIAHILSGSAPVAAEIPTGCAWLTGQADPQQEYVYEGKIIPRPMLEVHYPKTPVPPNETFRVSNIPPGTAVHYLGATILVDDGYFEWRSTAPGTYAFKLTCFPYQDEVVYAEIAYT